MQRNHCCSWFIYQVGIQALIGLVCLSLTSVAVANPIQARLGERFLSWNAKQPKVVTLSSGLQYKVIKPGSGPHPGPNSIVTFDYEGQFINGQTFDSSYKRSHPVTFPVRSLIPGWKQALLLMRPGAEWVLYVPPYLAYGKRGLPGRICGDQTLLFRVHLLAIQP